MLKKLIHPIYRMVHDSLNASSKLFFKQEFGGKPVKKGHISSEHLENPELDTKLMQSFEENGIKTAEYTINVQAYKDYLKMVNYPPSYYGGGLDPKQNFTEKTLEHYVSTEFFDFNPDFVFMDVAAATSPFHKIVKEHFGADKVYQQDLIYKEGIHGHQIGGSAGKLPLPDNSIDGVTLHCSLEHFEYNSDSELFSELNRVLRKGGKAVILPFYLAYEYTIHLDPAFNLIKRHKAGIDETAQIRYANWYQYFSRHYDAAALKKRVLSQTPDLDLTIHRVTNFKDVHPSCYLRFIGVFTKK